MSALTEGWGSVQPPLRAYAATLFRDKLHAVKLRLSDGDRLRPLEYEVADWCRNRWGAECGDRWAKHAIYHHGSKPSLSRLGLLVAFRDRSDAMRFKLEFA